MASIFRADGSQYWEGPGVMRLSLAARDFGGVSKITVQERRTRSVTDDEGRVKIHYKNGAHGYASFSCYGAAVEWAVRRAGDCRSAFYGCEVVQQRLGAWEPAQEVPWQR